MSHIVTESCIKCKHTDCVTVCPVDCFHEGVNFLVIDPEICIDCCLCVDECPVQAIYSESDLPEDMEHFTELNEKYAALWPVIDSQKEALSTAEEYSKIESKLDLLDPNAFKA